MQYIKHNFLKNYSNAVKSKDNRLANDILLDEIAKMVVFDRQLVCGTLKINSSASNTDLTKKVLKLAKTNARARKVLVNMIVDRNDYDKDKVADTSFDGKGLYKNTNAKGLITKERALISNAINGTLSTDGLEDSVADAKTEQHSANKSTILGGSDAATDFNYDSFKTIALKSLALTALGIGVFFLAKRYFLKKGMFADGGNIEETQPINTIQPQEQLPLEQQPTGGLEQQPMPNEQQPQQNLNQGWQPETYEQVALTQKLNIDNNPNTDNNVLQQ